MHFLCDQEIPIRSTAVALESQIRIIGPNGRPTGLT
jgi:hypothetical protein